MTTVEEKSTAYATVSECGLDFFIVLFGFLFVYFCFFFFDLLLFIVWVVEFLGFRFSLCLFICSLVGVLLPGNE